MTYKELRQRLRADGFINAEIVAVHHQYLAVRAIGIDDADIIFDREHGVLLNQRAMAVFNAANWSRVVVDAENDRAAILPD